MSQRVQFRASLDTLWGRINWAQADLNQVRRIAAELRELGNVTCGALTQVLGCHAGGWVCLLSEEFTTAWAYPKKAFALYDPAHRPSYAELLPVDMLVQLLVHASLPLACLGYLDQARSRVTRR
jgi:hypothetical protein